jgi:hypothetical protein
LAIEVFFNQKCNQKFKALIPIPVGELVTHVLKMKLERMSFQEIFSNFATCREHVRTLENLRNALQWGLRASRNCLSRVAHSAVCTTKVAATYHWSARAKIRSVTNIFLANIGIFLTVNEQNPPRYIGLLKLLKIPTHHAVLRVGI